MKEITDDIEHRVKKIITTRLNTRGDIGKISKYTPLIGKGLGLDSVSVLELLAGLEEEFNIIFDDSELNIEFFENVGSLTNYINKKLGHV
jgi:acyl carrier protein